MPVIKELRKTKIIATIGPACDAPEVLREMMLAGLNVARLNLSHGSYEEHQKRLDRIRQVADKNGFNVAVMVDTRGIEIRTGKLIGKTTELEPGGEFTLYTDARPGDRNGVSVSNQNLPHEVEIGAPILLDDGAIELVITGIDDGRIHCRIIHGGRLGEHKSVNLPETQLAASLLSPEYRDDIAREVNFASANEVEYLAASFMQSAADVSRLKELMQQKGQRIPIIAKIENRAGVENLEEIVQEANGIMVARGDLGVELPLADVPGMQKHIISHTVLNGKPVITATEMLASMERNPRPTRAEASDVANAILDGTSAVMLSGETAIGAYPVEAIKTMAALALRAESSLRDYGYLQQVKPNPTNRVTESVALAATTMAGDMQAAAIFCLTETGFSSRLLSKHRPECPIIAVTSSQQVARRLALNWGVAPLLYSGEDDDKSRISYTMQRAMKAGYVEPGSVVICTSGHHQTAGSTDLIRVIVAD